MVSNGLGFSSRELLPNKGKINRKFLKDAFDEYFHPYDYCDYGRTEDSFSVGVEPTYQFDPLKIVTIARNKEESAISVGSAAGPYGSGVRGTRRLYSEYMYRSKFVKFVDKWHRTLFPGEYK
jgi:hypothetical protein